MPFQNFIFPLDDRLLLTSSICQRWPGLVFPKGRVYRINRLTGWESVFGAWYLRFHLSDPCPPGRSARWEDGSRGWSGASHFLFENHLSSRSTSRRAAPCHQTLKR